mgnify:CR=1 FL=1
MFLYTCTKPIILLWWICTFTEEIDLSEDDEGAMNVDMEPVSEEKSSDEEDIEEDEVEFDTVTTTDVGNDVERYDEKMDLFEEEETMKKIKGKHCNLIK